MIGGLGARTKHDSSCEQMIGGGGLTPLTRLHYDSVLRMGWGWAHVCEHTSASTLRV
jgi:hypothetical protein